MSDDSVRETTPQEESAELRAELDRIDTVERALPDWIALQSIESEMKSLGALPPFPDDGIERYEALRENLAAAKEKLTVIKNKLECELNLMSQTQSDPSLRTLRFADKIELMESELRESHSNETEASLLEREEKDRTAALSDDIRALAPNWSESDLRKADTYVTSSPSLVEFDREVNKLRGEIDKLRRQNDRETALVTVAESELLSLRNEVAKLSDTPESLDAARTDILGIREAFLSHQEASQEKRVLSAERFELLQELSADDKFKASREYKLMYVFMLLFAGACGAAAFLLGHFVEGFAFFSYIWVLTTIFLTVPASFLFINGLSRERALLEVWHSVRAQKAARLEAVEKKLLPLEAQLVTLSRMLHAHAARLKLDEDEALESIETLAEKLEDKRLCLRQYTELKEKERRLTAMVADAKKHDTDVEVQIRALESRIKSHYDTMRDWLRKNNYPPDMEPTALESFLTKVRGAQRELAELDALRAKLAARRDAVDGFRSRSIALIKEVSSAFPASSFGALSDLAQLFAALESARAVDKKLKDTQDGILRLESERSACEEIMNGYIAEIKNLFSEAGVTGENEFRALASKWEQHWTLWANLTERWQNISAVFGGRKAAEQAAGELGSDPAARRARRVSILNRLQIIERIGAVNGNGNGKSDNRFKRNARLRKAGYGTAD